MTKLKNHDVHIYLEYQDHRWLEDEAQNRRLSLSKTARDCLSEYACLRRELATALEHPGQAGDQQEGTIIHTLLVRTEERLAATIEQQTKRISELQDQLLVLTSMIDRMYLGIMQHLPEVPNELAKSAVVSAKRRHKKWLDGVEQLLGGEQSLDG